MGRPASAHHGFVMDDDADARWGNGCSIEIKGSMKLCPGGESQVDVGTPE